MAKIVTPRGPVVPGPAGPVERESRQTGIEVKVPAGVGVGGFNYTPIVGQQVWLLGIDFWAFGVGLGVTLGGFILQASHRKLA